LHIAWSRPADIHPPPQEVLVRHFLSDGLAGCVRLAG
jgi:hypothetical protein